MKETAIQTDKSRFPLVYEAMVWVLYTALYKYAYYLDLLRAPKTYENFPHMQMMLYALAMTLYVIPFYRWLAPALLNRKKYGWLMALTLCWFLFVPKISNVCVSYVFMKGNGPGYYKEFFTFWHSVHTRQALHLLTGWDFQVLLTDLIAFTSVAITRFAFDNERKKRLLEKDVFRLQLDALNAQLNPHFLFNTLNSIYGMSLTGSSDTPEYVLRLADMMRYTLYDCRKDKVELEKDLAFTANYVAMEKKRYPLSDIRLTVSNSNGGVLIAPLLLIPFIENSFKHGAHRLNDKGFIHAQLEIDEEKLHFVVENDIMIAPVQPAGSGGIGIDNVKKRLQMYYPGKHHLEIKSTGTTFTVVLTILFK
ncbi:MAG TPA: histidine kinase [Niastella sp.]